VAGRLRPDFRITNKSPNGQNQGNLVTQSHGSSTKDSRVAEENDAHFSMVPGNFHALILGNRVSAFFVRSDNPKHWGQK